MIDGLHEDLNKVIDKPILRDINGTGKSDELLSKLYLKQHKKRNNSEIMKLLMGQYKSTVDCPDCENISYKFDPFYIVSVPIP